MNSLNKFYIIYCKSMKQFLSTKYLQQLYQQYSKYEFSLIEMLCVLTVNSIFNCNSCEWYIDNILKISYFT